MWNIIPIFADFCYLSHMRLMTIGSTPPARATDTPHIYCPSLVGLSARLADAAFLMPRMDQNQQVKNAPGHGHWAAAIAADPFGTTDAFFSALTEAGYSGLVNWPSSILLEGHTQQQISTIPATPAAEYAYLAQGQAKGLQSLAFFLTQDQAAEAQAAGLRDLVLHPGILLDVDPAGAAMIRGALAAMIASVKQAQSDCRVWVYTSDWHDGLIGLSELRCDGIIRFVETPA